MSATPAQSPRLRAAAVRDAAARIDPVFLHSPQFVSEPLSDALGARLTVKLETLNPIRSFKGRGADNLVALLAERRESRPLLCASAGNWGQALAYACRKRALPLTVFAAVGANALKLERMAALGATVIRQGADFDAAKDAARAHADATGGLLLEDGREPEITEGHGTLAAELTDHLGPWDDIVAPLGNGALLNGIGLWMKHAAPGTRVVGVCAAGAPAMRDSWLAGPGAPVVTTTTAETIADGIAVRVPVPEAVADMQGLVDAVDLVTDDDVIEAMRLAHRHLGIVLEPAGAAGLATLVAHPARYRGRDVAVVLCGGNLTQEQMRQWLG